MMRNDESFFTRIVLIPQGIELLEGKGVNKIELPLDEEGNCVLPKYIVIDNEHVSLINVKRQIQSIPVYLESRVTARYGAIPRTMTNISNIIYDLNEIRDLLFALDFMVEV